MTGERIGNPKLEVAIKCVHEYNSLWNGHAGQFLALTEGPVLNSRNALRNCHIPFLALRTADQYIPLKQDSIYIAIHRISFVDQQFRQFLAAREDSSVNLGDALRDGYTGQARAAIESLVPDFRDAFRDGHAGQALAATEGIFANLGDAFWNSHIPAGACVLLQNVGVPNYVPNDKILIAAHNMFLLCIWPGNAAPREFLLS